MKSLYESASLVLMIVLSLAVLFLYGYSSHLSSRITKTQDMLVQSNTTQGNLNDVMTKAILNLYPQP